MSHLKLFILAVVHILLYFHLIFFIDFIWVLSDFLCWTFIGVLSCEKRWGNSVVPELWVQREVNFVGFVGAVHTIKSNFESIYWYFFLTLLMKVYDIHIVYFGWVILVVVFEVKVISELCIYWKNQIQSFKRSPKNIRNHARCEDLSDFYMQVVMK